MAKKPRKIAQKIAEKALPEVETEKIKRVKIRVIGIGGGGGNIVSELSRRVKRASFFVADTDLKALHNLPRGVEKFQFGQSLTQGLGTGMNPEKGEEAAQNEKERIKEILAGQDFVILIACLGGGIGSGASSIFAQISKNLGNLTYGIFTLPFSFEGEKKMEIAKDSLRKMKGKLNAFTPLPNERIFQLINKNIPLKKTFLTINKNLADSLQSLLEIIFKPGLINIDFADLRTIFEGRGTLCYLNSIEIEKAADKEVIEKALHSPLCPYSIEGAKGILFNISGKNDLSLAEIGQISKIISEKVNKEAKIIFGLSQPKKDSGIKITLLATGCTRPRNEIFRLKIKKKLKPKILKKEKKTTTSPPPEGPKRKFGRAEGGSESRKRAPKVEIKKEVQKRKKEMKSKKKIPVKKMKTKKKFKKQKNEKPLLEPKAETKKEEKTIVRKNGLSLKKEIEEEEAALLAKEKIWETPTFLRKKLIKE
jgi:cell division protein FtsZ